MIGSIRLYTLRASPMGGYSRLICPKQRLSVQYVAFSMCRVIRHEHEHEHSHGHDHPHKPATAVDRVKAFFNPHTPLKDMGGHSHSHSHSHHTLDPEARKLYETKDFWNNPGVKITWVGLGVNLLMAGSKFVGGVYFHSQALIADAVHALGDLVSDVLTLTTVNFSGKKSNELYPLGYGKIETIGAMLVSAILLYAGLQIGWGSMIQVITPIVPDSIMEWVHSLPMHSHSHGDSHGEVANINAAWLALGSIFIKEWLFKTTKSIGEKMNSNVLIANAWHHRVDSLTSIVALVTISGGYFLNVQWLDPVGGLIVSMLIIKVGISGVFQSFKELIDKAMPRTDPEYMQIKNRIETHIANPKLVVKDLVVLPSGTNMNLNVIISVNPAHAAYSSEISLSEISEVAKTIKTNLHNDYSNLKAACVEFE